MSLLGAQAPTPPALLQLSPKVFSLLQPNNYRAEA